MLQFEYTYLMEITEIISLNVKTFRAKKGITQKALAVACGVGEQQIRDIEAGRRKPSIDLLFSISVALGVNSGDLLDEPEGRKPLRLEPPRKVLQKYMMIPDEVVDLIYKVNPSDATWENIIGALEVELESKQGAEKRG